MISRGIQDEIGGEDGDFFFGAFVEPRFIAAQEIKKGRIMRPFFKQ
jgi:hypothetical protein